MEPAEQTQQDNPEEPSINASSTVGESSNDAGDSYAPPDEQGGAENNSRKDEAPGEAEPRKQGVNIDSIDADSVIVTGADQRRYDNSTNTTNQFFGDEERMVILPIDQDTLQPLRRVFIKPPGYKKFLQDSLASGDRVCLIHGNESSGKLTCAINLAQDLLEAVPAEKAKIYIYPRRVDETRPLVDAMGSDQICDGSAVIIEDVFEKKVPRNELQPPELDWLRGALNGRRLFLILTAQLSPAEADLFPLAKVSTRGLDLFKVMVSQFRYMQAQAGEEVDEEASKEAIRRLEANWDALKKVLREPQQIERFSKKLVDNPPRDDAELLSLAQQSARMSKRALRGWFSALRSNERLFATLVYLCSGTERSVIEQLYVKALRFLREGGLTWFTDPRKLGLEDLLDSIRGRDLGGYIDFSDRPLEEEVRLQIGNWAHLLWSVVDVWVALVDGKGEWDDWQIRRALGVALGRLCVHGNDKFKGALISLASHPSTKVAVIPGYALEAAVRRDPEHQAQLTLKILEDWIGSGDPDLMWAAGAAIKRVYNAFKSLAMDQNLASWEIGMQDSLIKQLEGLISESMSFNPKVVERIEREVKERQGTKELKKAVDGRCWRLGQENRDCGQIAIQSIALTDPSRSVVLAKWLRDTRAKSFKKEVAEAAVQEIFQALGKARYRLVEERQAPFLGLIEPVLEAAGKGEGDLKRIDQMFLTVKRWLRWESWYEPIFQALLDVANHGSSDVRAKLRSALSRLWLHRGSNLESKQAFEIAQAVIARAYAMDGALMDRPRLGRCVFVLDPTFLGGDEEARKEKVYRHLIGLLEAHVDVSVVHLGARDAVQLKDQSPLLLAVDYSVPPLVMPALEAAWTADTRLVLVLTARRLWDLEDVAGQPWAKDFFVVAAGDEVGEHEGIKIIPIGKDPKPEEVEKVEKALQTRWARALAQAGPWDWWGVLQSFGVGEEIEEGPRPWLGRLVGGLSDIGQATGHGDLARKILCILGWYAARDLRACAQLLQSWLGDGALPFQKWMGAAGARALLAIHSAETPSPEDSAPEILFEELAAPLAAQGKDGSEAVLRAVRQWIEEPLWAEYLAGDVVEGRGRLLRWAEQFAPQQAGGLRRLLPEVKEMPAAPLREESLAAMLERLHLLPVLGEPKVLPDLAVGERYALIALDTADLKASTAANLDTVAIDLFRSLNSRNGHSLKPVIYRLGERRPVWVAGAPPPPRDVLLVPEAPRQPRLLGPILMDPISLVSTQLVLVLTTQPLLDAEDWLETEWRERIVFYQPGADGERHPGFAAVPALNGKSTGVAIARFLLRDAEGEVANEDAASAAA